MGVALYLAWGCDESPTDCAWSDAVSLVSPLEGELSCPGETLCPSPPTASLLVWGKRLPSSYGAWRCATLKWHHYLSFVASQINFHSESIPITAPYYSTRNKWNMVMDTKLKALRCMTLLPLLLQFNSLAQDSHHPPSLPLTPPTMAMASQQHCRLCLVSTKKTAEKGMLRER